ncbi:MarR family winged helix-turn-helix transcriptional regulator [Sporomusa acidovorans]|uniref:HTH marR-type domain-containing protein n=1 Tax=Sporomusa acidovorans (strain ATCC 49682 / DSM 3132 / Mol) TaxID=1123286 RepID=A0ABZ3IY92_SPOA4|nr:MarR family transcriptional regulator [Sporomusa acidovorans]OZC17164.1 DNA-binding transcriptional repressor MarR [Sporomusa acidovorans DSM 3132]SDE81067.1 DNA-binding transcriptional regulator, MarR family [Sporomusa acidovorans]
MDNNERKEVAGDILQLVFQLQKKVMRHVMQESKLDVSPLQVHVLDTLKEEKIATMTMMAKETRMPKTQMTRIIDKLVTQGLVQREYDAADRRIIKIKLTEAGLTLVDCIKAEAVEVVNEKLKILDDKQLTRIKESASRMFEVIKGLP